MSKPSSHADLAAYYELAEPTPEPTPEESSLFSESFDPYARKREEELKTPSPGRLKTFSQITFAKQVLKAKREYMDLRLKTHLQRWQAAASLLKLKQEVQFHKPFKHEPEDKDYLDHPDAIPKNLEKEIIQYAKCMQKISSDFQKIIDEMTHANVEYKSGAGKGNETLENEFVELWIHRTYGTPREAKTYIEALKIAGTEFDAPIDESFELSQIIENLCKAIEDIWKKNREAFLSAVQAYDGHVEKLKAIYRQKEEEHAANEQKYKKVTARVIKNENNPALQKNLNSLGEHIQGYLSQTAPSNWRTAGADVTGKAGKQPNTHDFLQFLLKFLRLIRYETMGRVETERKSGEGLPIAQKKASGFLGFMKEKLTGVTKKGEDGHFATSDSIEMFRHLYKQCKISIPDEKVYDILSYIPQDMKSEISKREIQVNSTSQENSSFEDIEKRQARAREQEEKEQKVKTVFAKEAEGSVPLDVVIDRLQLFLKYIEIQHSNKLLEKIHNDLAELIFLLGQQQKRSEDIEKRNGQLKNTYAEKQKKLDDKAAISARTGKIKKIAEDLAPSFAHPRAQPAPTYVFDQKVEAFQSPAVAHRRYALDLSKQDGEWLLSIDGVRKLDRDIFEQFKELPDILDKLPQHEKKEEKESQPKVGSTLTDLESSNSVAAMFSGTAVGEEPSQTGSSLAVLQNVCRSLKSPPAVELFKLELQGVMQGWLEKAKKIDRRLAELEKITKEQQAHPQLVQNVLKKMESRAKQKIIDYKLPGGSGIAVTPLDLLKNSLYAWSNRSSLKEAKIAEDARKLFDYLDKLGRAQGGILVGDLIKYLNSTSERFYVGSVEIFKKCGEKVKHKVEKITDFDDTIKYFEMQLNKLSEIREDKLQPTIVSESLDTLAPIIASIDDYIGQNIPNFKKTEMCKNYNEGLKKIADRNKKILYVSEFLKKIIAYARLDYDKEIIGPIKELSELSKKLVAKEYSHILISDDLKKVTPSEIKGSSTIVLLRVGGEKSVSYRVSFIEKNCFVADEEKETYNINIELTQEEIEFLSKQTEGTEIKPENNRIWKQIVYKATSKREAFQRQAYDISYDNNENYKELFKYYRDFYAREELSDDRIIHLMGHVIRAASSMQREILQLLINVKEAGGAIGFSSELYRDIVECYGKSLPEQRFILRKIISQQIAEITRIQQEKVNSSCWFLREAFDLSLDTPLLGDEILTQARASAKKIDDFSHKLEATKAATPTTINIKPMSYLDYYKAPAELDALTGERNKLADRVQETAGKLKIEIPPSPSLAGKVSALITGITGQVAEKSPKLSQPETVPLSSLPVPVEPVSEQKMNVEVKDGDTLEAVITEMYPEELQPGLKEMGALVAQHPIQEPEEIVRSRMPEPVAPVTPAPTSVLPAPLQTLTTTQRFLNGVVQLINGGDRQSVSSTISTTATSAVTTTVSVPVVPEEEKNIPKDADGLLFQMGSVLDELDRCELFEERTLSKTSGDVRSTKTSEQIEEEAEEQKKISLLRLHAQEQLDKQMKIWVTFPEGEFTKIWLDERVQKRHGAWRPRLRDVINKAAMNEQRHKALIDLISPPVSSSIPVPRSLTPPAPDFLPEMCDWTLEESEKFAVGEEIVAIQQQQTFLKEVKQTLAIMRKAEGSGLRQSGDLKIARVLEEEKGNLKFIAHKNMKELMGKLAKGFAVSEFLQIWSNRIFDTSNSREGWKCYLIAAIESQKESLSRLKYDALLFLANAPYYTVDDQIYLQICFITSKNFLWPASFIALKTTGKQFEGGLQYDEKWKQTIEKVEVENLSPKKTRHGRKKMKLPLTQRKPSIVAENGSAKDKIQGVLTEAAAKLRLEHGNFEPAEITVERSRNTSKRKKVSNNLKILQKLSLYFKVNVMIKREDDSPFNRLIKKNYKHSIYFCNIHDNYYPLIPIETLNGEEGIRKIILFMKAVKSLSAPAEDKVMPRSITPPRKSSSEGAPVKLSTAIYGTKSPLVAASTTTATPTTTTATTTTSTAPSMVTVMSPTSGS